MTDYNSEYFFVQSDDENERLPFMTPDLNAAERQYSYESLPMGSAPLVFTNGFREDFKEDGIKEEIADVLFDASTFIVRDHIRKALMNLELPNVRIHPAIYIDDNDNWHEDFWYVGIKGFLDCWDRATSRYNPTDFGSTDAPRFNVYSYSLSAEVLEKTPRNERMLFRMGGTTDGHVVCHQSLVKLFRDGTRIRPIDYKVSVASVPS